MRKRPLTEEERANRNLQMKMATMRLDWESWEWLFREDIQRLDNRIQACYQSMQTVGIPRDMREVFVLNKIREIISEVANHQNTQ